MIFDKGGKISEKEKKKDWFPQNTGLAFVHGNIFKD